MVGSLGNIQFPSIPEITSKLFTEINYLFDLRPDLGLFARAALIAFILFVTVICFLRLHNRVVEKLALDVGGGSLLDGIKIIGVSAHEISHLILYIIGLFKIESVTLYVPFKKRQDEYLESVQRIENSNKSPKEKEEEKENIPAACEGAVAASPTIFRFYQYGMLSLVPVAPILLIPIFISFIESLLWNGSAQGFYTYANLSDTSTFLNFGLPLFLSSQFSIKSVLVFLLMMVIGAIFCSGIYPGNTDLHLIMLSTLFLWMYILEIISKLFGFHDGLGLFIWNCIGWSIRGIIICALGQIFLFVALKLILRHRQSMQINIDLEGQEQPESISESVPEPAMVPVADPLESQCANKDPVTETPSDLEAEQDINDFVQGFHPFDSLQNSLYYSYEALIKKLKIPSRKDMYLPQAPKKSKTKGSTKKPDISFDEIENYNKTHDKYNENEH